MKNCFRAALCGLLTLLIAASVTACGGKTAQPSVTPSVPSSPPNPVSSVYSVQNAELILEMGQEALAKKTGATITGRIENSVTAQKTVYTYELSLNFADSLARFTLCKDKAPLFTAYGNEEGFVVKEGNTVRPLSALLTEYGLDVLNPFLEQFSASDLSAIISVWDDNFGDTVLGKRDGDGYMLSANSDFSQTVNSYLTQFRPLFSLTGKELLTTLLPDLIEGDPDEWFAAKKTALTESAVKDLFATLDDNPTFVQIASHVTLELFGVSYVDFIAQYGEQTVPTLLSTLLKEVEGVSPALTSPALLKLALNTLLQQAWDNPVQESLESAAEAIDPAYKPLVDLWLNRTVFTFADLAAEIGCNEDGTPQYGLFSAGIAGLHTDENGAQETFRKTVLLSMHFSYEALPIIVPEVSVEPSVEPSITPSVEPSVTPSVEISVAPSVEPSVAPSVEPSVAPSTAPSVEESVQPAA